MGVGGGWLEAGLDSFGFVLFSFACSNLLYFCFVLGFVFLEGGVPFVLLCLVLVWLCSPPPPHTHTHARALLFAPRRLHFPKPQPSTPSPPDRHNTKQFANLGTGTMDLLLDESKLSQAMELTQLDTTMARLGGAAGRGAAGGAGGYMGTPMGTPSGTPHFTPG